MAVSLKHSFNNPKSDGPDSSVVRPSDWNAEHVLTLGSNRVLGRVSSGTGAVEELTGTQVRSFADAAQLGVLAGINTRTASYTLVAADRGKLIEMNVSGANTVTVPNETGIGGVNFPIGTQILVVQTGAGATTVSPAAGVTIQSTTGGLTTVTRYSAVLLYKRASNNWIVVDQATAHLDGRVDNLETVAGGLSNVATVATNIGSVNTAAANIAGINNVSAAINNGDLLTDVYQGAGSVDPATRLDGSALQNGDFYFNTSTNRTRTLANGVWYDAYPGGNTNADLVAYLPPGTGAVATTAQVKFRQTISVFDFMTSAQIADVTAGTALVDVSAAIQAAINTLKPANGLSPEKGGTLYFPPGTYLVGTTISTYSAIELRGSGAATIMKAGPSLTGAIFQPAATAVTVIYIYGIIEGFRFITSGSVWAIKSTAENVLCSQFRNLTLETTYGISLCRPNTYTQASIISDVTSFGGVEQILALTGNFNQIERIDKEGATGTSTEPYIYVYGANASGPFGGLADGNSFKKILIEGDGSANKAPIKFLNASGNEIQDFWTELSNTNGYSIDLDNSKVRVRGFWQPGTVAKNKVKLRNGSSLYIDNFNSDTEDVDWQGYFDSDANSICYVEHLVSLRAANTFKIATPGNLFVQQQVVQLWNDTLPAGYSAQFAADYTSGQNLLINPSFEAGIYGWSMSSADTPTFTTSEVGQGLMFQCASTAGFQLTQSVVVSAGQIGKPLTIRYVAKIDGAGWAVPIIAGQAETGIHRVTAGQGWQTVTLTYRPATSGTLVFGLWWLGVGGTSSMIYVDEFSLCAGERGLINPAKFGSLELNQKTLTYATAAPTTGTWKVGDRVFNSAPAVNQPKGWICTVGGGPGTMVWVSEGDL